MHWADILHFLSVLTFQRVWNAGLVYVSYGLTRLLGRPVHWGAPITISFEPTTACNLRCPECPSGLRAFTRPTGRLREDFFRNMVDTLSADALCLILYFQGEPYLNPDFLHMAAYARNRGLYVVTSTNGHFLDDEAARRTVESGLSRLIVSVDGATQVTYSAYRIGGDLEEVKAGIRRVVFWKKKLGSAQPYLILQCLIVRPNEHEIDDMRAMGRELGVDEVKFKTAQVYDYENGHELIPTIDRYARYRKEADGRWKLKTAMTNRCWKLWHACVITWDGAVVPCCFDKDASHRMGSLRSADFRSIWRGKAYADFRALLSKGRENVDICRNCSEGCRVWER